MVSAIITQLNQGGVLIKIKCIFFFVYIFLSPLMAQFDLPATQVYSFDIGQDIEEKWHIYNPTRIIGIKSKGYVDQPYFHSSSSIYLATEKSRGYTEIISLNLADASWKYMTENSFSEFSPKPQFGKSWATLSVLEDESGKQSQELWLHSRLNSKRLFPDFNNIGYYLALTGDVYVLFLIEDMNILAIANRRSGTINKFISNPGRCFQKISESEFYFVQILEGDVGILKKYDSQSKASEIITQMPLKVQDFVILSDGSFLVHYNGGFHRYNPNSSKPQWKLIQKTRNYGIEKGARIAYNGTDKLVLISPIE